MNEYYPCALTIAGSDSGGGAGIQADLRTFAAFGVFGCSVITAVTAQNPIEVKRVDPLPEESVEAQLNAICSEFALKAIKTGMLFNRENIEIVSRSLNKLNIPLIVDPVMVSTSGVRLLQEDAVESLKNELLKLATWITPNVPEAEILTGMKISSIEDMTKAAVFCSEIWNCGCILKGGHLLKDKNFAIDLVARGDKVYKLISPLVSDSKASHGTGCTFSSALAASLAIGGSWKKSLRWAKGFVYGSLKEPVQVGKNIEAMYPPPESEVDKISLELYS
jgi:hydroxymethylpyrimidine/phosphomethylpyrimidine kinase